MGTHHYISVRSSPGIAAFVRVCGALGVVLLCARYGLLTDTQARDLSGLYLVSVLGLEGYKRGRRSQDAEPTAEPAEATSPALVRDGGDEAGADPIEGTGDDGGAA